MPSGSWSSCTAYIMQTLGGGPCITSPNPIVMTNVNPDQSVQTLAAAASNAGEFAKAYFARLGRILSQMDVEQIARFAAGDQVSFSAIFTWAEL